jgi:predicted DNA binding CopG/RHH family protein
MSKKIEKIEGTVEAWESGLLGRDEEFAKAVKVDEQLVDDSLELQMISIRLQKSLLEELKMIAGLYGLGYQPLIKQILRRFVDCEMKQLLRDYSAIKNKDNKDTDDSNTEDMQEAC